MDVWLCLHYSDIVSPPHERVTPDSWASLEEGALSDTIFNYTKRVVDAIGPSIVQIGSEVNSSGAIGSTGVNLSPLLRPAISACVESDASIKKMLHVTNIIRLHQYAEMASRLNLDFDIIAFSPSLLLQGMNMNAYESSMIKLKEEFDMELMIAEVSYPFTLENNDNTLNAMNTNTAFTLQPEFAANRLGQAGFIENLKNRLQIAGGTGMCYFGGERVAFKGKEATDGPNWENQALFDFDHKALPALGVLGR